jgi:CPA1 family monovalent cation:H+ antiporter
MKIEYKQMIAHRVALTRVMQRLTEIKANQEFDPEFVGYQMALVEGQLDEVKEKLVKLETQNEFIREFASEQLREELLAIESDTYAEFIRAGQLKDELTPLLQSVLPDRLGEAT